MGATDLRIFLTVWLVVACLADPRPDGVQNRYLALTLAVAETGSVAVDPYLDVDMTDVVSAGGRSLSGAFPGHPFLLVPLMPLSWALAPVVGDAPGAPGVFRALALLAVVLVQAPAAGLAAALLHRLLRDLGAAPAAAVVVGLSLPLGTHLLFSTGRVSPRT